MTAHAQKGRQDVRVDSSAAWMTRLAFHASFVPPSRFYGGPWTKYLRPRRLTLRGPGRLAVYRWLVWNFSIGGGT